ncbi:MULTISPECIES: NAD-dependent epimerase/dehydratase family protein [Enterobacter]|uniref:NAD-dependent epimerase/dehydratase family protein n=1 Tax=Enterobacter TaxID=547 RepID=UPI00048276C7|nr:MULTISPECIES: NAD-dependent epimerase/dehydratase family protein [Enterobacter cloacae complex]HDT2076661.1 NAD-dependent epimerase/dehydratase family protein [Enterobacter roggenkampii]HEG2003470.1 NAD-dependent epimerase/dehydratase family protein [Enterobacter asburiae]MCD2457128.1 NAD-dependent epimerase/dehydratase family protein [Enterobacter cloacae complex sp. 2021EL-01261]HDT2078833.1 NAD-dependent epimerase/dehydratase family protein [Enterobacter roggenkampii]HDT2095460.1 NAD-dep
METRGKVLILGATGGIGGETARQLIREKWEVRALKRGSHGSELNGEIQWIAGDALDKEQVASAAKDCSVIVHAVNPPGYRNWQHLVLPMLRNTINAAERNGSLIVLPGTVYNYGPDAFPLLREDAQQRPVTRKGAIRVQMEKELEAYSQRGGRVLVVRAGDFFGPHAGNNWFSQGLIKPGTLPKVISNPGTAETGHQWAYLPDIAKTIAALLARREELEPFARFHMQGHWDPDGSQMVRAIQRITAHYGGVAKIHSFPWWFMHLAAPFNATLRELLEMRYLWRQSVRLDNTKLVTFLGAEPHTPLDEAVRMTLQGLGCLTARSGRSN